MATSTGASAGSSLPRPAPTRLLRTLRSVRRFAPRPIPGGVLRDVLEVGRWTGSSKNSQPWEVVVVRDRGMLEQLARLGQFAGHLAGADAAIVLVMDSPSNALDAGRLAQNLMLAAWAHGVGSCIASLFPEENERRAKELLGVPAERWVRTAISLGYSADARARVVSSTPGLRGTVPLGRKPLAEFASWERYGRREPSRQ